MRSAVSPPARATEAPAALILTVAVSLHACGGPEEAPRIDVPVVADASGLRSVTTDLGYRFELTEARVMVEDLSFAIGGEVTTASLWRRVADWLVPAAQAHPGHLQAGDVTGELRGRFLASWLPAPGGDLGRATLIAGSYRSANFTFARAGAEDGVPEDDGLFGHTAVLRGNASQGGSTVAFIAVLDSPPGRELIGAPCEVEIGQGGGAVLGVRLLAEDRLEHDTLFDGLDFAALDADGDGQLRIDSSATEAAAVAAYQLLLRTFQTHDHFDVGVSPRGD